MNFENMRAIILYITIILSLTYCSKDKIDISDFVECNNEQNLDSTSISAKLIGIWTLKKQSIPYSKKFRNVDKNIKATFNNDSTYSVTENSNVLMQGTWKLVYHSQNNYSLRSDEFSHYISGAVYF